MKTSPIKAVIRLMLNTTRQYAIDITFVITLTCFHNPWNHRFHNVQAWEPVKMERNIRTHITLTVKYTNTHENWADSFCHSGNAGKSHNLYICFLLFLFLFEGRNETTFLSPHGIDRISPSLSHLISPLFDFFSDSLTFFSWAGKPFLLDRKYNSTTCSNAFANQIPEQLHTCVKIIKK